MRSIFVILILPVLAALPGDVFAQRREPTFPSLDQEGRRVPEQYAGSVRPAGNLAGSVLGGVLGGTAGFFAGALIGGNLENGYFPCNCDDPGLVGAIYGALIGETIGLATGAHLGNGRRGNLGLDVLISAGTAVLGVATLSGGDGSALVALPIAQVVAVVLTELSVGKSKVEGR